MEGQCSNHYPVRIIWRVQLGGEYFRIGWTDAPTEDPAEGWTRFFIFRTMKKHMLEAVLNFDTIPYKINFFTNQLAVGPFFLCQLVGPFIRRSVRQSIVPPDGIEMSTTTRSLSRTLSHMTHMTVAILTVGSQSCCAVMRRLFLISVCGDVIADPLLGECHKSFFIYR